MFIYNPTDTEQKFYYGGIPYTFRSKESRDFSDEIGTFALKRGNRNLVLYNPSFDKEMEFTDMDYKTMPWNKLRNLASARKVFTPGVKREDVEKALEEYDNAQTGTLPESTS